MNAEVIIPWRNGCEHRQAALTWILGRWATITDRVTIAPLEHGPWIKAKAIWPAVLASTADVIVLADADVWNDHIPDAIAAAGARHAGWATPHQRVRRLNEAATALVLAGAEPDTVACYENHVAAPGGGITAIRRSTLLQVPLDPRFEGWGGEDWAWAIALTQLVGRPWRAPRALHHLWHPAQPRIARHVGSQQSLDLLHRYQRAHDDLDALEALIDEAKEALACPDPAPRSSTLDSSTT